MDPLDKLSAINPKKAVASLFDEFKGFAFKGNVIDLSLGVIIGTAFAKIIDSLVKHVFMPLISVVIPSNQDYVHWSWTLNGVKVPFGLFIAELINFLIVTLVLFLFVVKFLGWFVKYKKAAAPPALTKDQILLAEIRDLLKQEKRAD